MRKANALSLADKVAAFLTFVEVNEKPEFLDSSVILAVALGRQALRTHDPRSEASRTWMESKTNLSDKTAVSALARLEKLGVIKRITGTQSGKRYAETHGLKPGATIVELCVPS